MSDRIDIVYSWVNGRDESWLNKVQDTIGVRKFESLNLWSRYSDNGELALSLLSVRKFASGFDRIFVVHDDCQTPDLPIHSTRGLDITFVPHSRFIDNKYLPTFNTFTIEAFVPLIPDLASRFVYFNDDIMAISSVNFQDFFNRGLPVYGVTKKRVPEVTPVSPAYQHASFNANNLLQVKLGQGIRSDRCLLDHLAYPMLTGMCIQALDWIRDNRYAFTKTRERTNYATTSFLYPYYCIEKEYGFLTQPRRDVMKCFNEGVSQHEKEICELLGEEAREIITQHRPDHFFRSKERYD